VVQHNIRVTSEASFLEMRSKGGLYMKRLLSMKGLLTVLGMGVSVAKWFAHKPNRMKVKHILGKLNITPTLGKK
jgi:hypothetical protein